MSTQGLFAGRDPRAGMEGAADHRARLGALPAGGARLIDILERSGLRGRGGAAFPVATKWASVAGRSSDNAVVLANGAEGEPLSHKDRRLMECRPHLVLDGVVLAAGAVGADEAVLYVGAEHAGAVAALRRALAERGGADRLRFRLVVAPPRYVAGEETAAVHFVNDGIALPTSAPPRPFERGVAGRPTLVQNVETLAHVALIARWGDAWHRQRGREGTTGTLLATVTGSVARPGVVEVAQGTTVGAVTAIAGHLTQASQAVLLGGYFGGWVAAGAAWDLRLDSVALREQGRALGCAVVSVLPEQRCGVVETARIAAYLAGESARQCGPCVFGLRAMAGALERLATHTSREDDLGRLERWTAQVRGRGACHHPDGAAGLVASALRVFGAEFHSHHEQRRCAARATRRAAA